MTPTYANTFGIRKVTNQNGDIVEVTLDISYKYMENTITFTNKGLENISAPAADQIASVVMNYQSAMSLRNLLIQTLRTEDDM